MKPRVGIVLAGLVLALCVHGCFYVNYKLERSLDPPEGKISLAGLAEEASVKRDSFGIPFVEAKSERDLFLATGYAMASDRLWQMVALKMFAQGRLAEIVGPDALPTDVVLRTLGVRHYADKAYEQMDPGEKDLLARFAEGVNAYLATHEHLPIEFDLTGYVPEPWQPRDSLSIFGLLNLGLASNLAEELAFLALLEKLDYRYDEAAYLFPIYPDEDLPFEEAKKLEGVKLAGLGPAARNLARSLEELSEKVGLTRPASNNWALAGSRTQSGKPIVENDTHLMLTMPSFWMILHLKSPTYEAAGVMVPGIPITTLGFNGKIAWGATMVMGDSQDLFVEKLENRDSGPCYVFQDRCLPLEEREEIFQVKGKGPITKKVRSTHHGPLINEALEGLSGKDEILPFSAVPLAPRHGLAHRWSMADGERGLKGFYRMGKASTMEEAREALSLVDSIYLNVLYGDASHIAWQVTGRFPDRRKGTGELPSPGWTGDYEWDGYLPFGEQPHVVDPPEGYLATANNRTVPPGGPHPMSSSWYGPERVERIRQLAGGLEGATYRGAMDMQSDQHSLMAEKTQRLLFEGDMAGAVRASIDGWKDEDRRREAREALEMLSPKKFDCTMRRESAGAALLGAFHHSFTRNVFLDELGPEGSASWTTFLEANFESYGAPEDHLLVRDSSPFFDDTRTPAVESKADMLATSLADAYALCEDRMGRDPSRWQWGKIHTYEWKHEVAQAAPFLLGPIFDRGPFPAGGDMQTLNVTGYYWGKDFDVRFIPAMRLVVDFGREDPAFLITHGGESGDPASPHYDDMIQPWMRVENQPLPFRPENIAGQYQQVLTLIPAPAGEPLRAGSSPGPAVR